MSRAFAARERALNPPKRASLKEELRAILVLALPMMVAQGGLMAMGVVDTLVIGRVSSLDMAGVALGNSVAGVIIVFGVGMAMGIEPLVSQSLGAGDPVRARAWLWQGMYLAVLVSIPLVILTALATQAFLPIGISPEMAAKTSAYLWARLPGIVFNCACSALRAYLTSIGRPRPVLIAVVAANVLNLLLDLVLVFGFMGSPSLGVLGVGAATSAAWIFMALVLFRSVRRMPVVAGDASQDAFVKPSRQAIRMIAGLGWPIGLQISIEVGIFTLVSALIARMGEVQLAGHQIALTLASFSFMCAVGIAIATSARVGFYVGASNTAMARRTGILGIAIGGAFMGVAGLLYALLRHPLAAEFAPTDPDAQRAGADLLVIAAIFAVSDGVQVVSAGALRGAGDTRWPFFANLAAHWVVGLPIALYLGHSLSMQSAGYWWGLTAGLFGVAITLTLRFLRLSSRPIVRIAVPEPLEPPA